MNVLEKIRHFFRPEDGREFHKALNWTKFIGPGLLVTVGFIDPGNWASNLAAGSTFGYALLWVVTLSTIMLIILQHNAAHLGIATGLCLSEAATKYFPPWLSRTILGSAVLASVSTVLAEVLGGAIALGMLFGLPVVIGAVLITGLVAVLLITNSYRKIEKWIIGFVSIIGFSFLYELTLVKVDWIQAAVGWSVPSFPDHSIPVIMSILGAVVMPHNLFLHSEVIQSRQWNLADEAVIHHQLKFEFLDTLVSMLIGFAINSAMILLAASAFFTNHQQVSELAQAQHLLSPLLGSNAAVVFALALLFSGLASSVTAGMAGGSIFAGMFGEPFDIKDRHSQVGVAISLVVALVIIFFVTDSFQALVVSQIVLSIQLPLTIFTLIFLTSSKKVMGKFVNKTSTKVVLFTIGAIVTALNVVLLVSVFS
jgi:manganese transport protein